MARKKTPALETLPEVGEQFAERVLEFKRLRVGDVAVNPKNHRTHPEHQLIKLRASISHIGKVGTLLAYHSDEMGGALTLVDGEARRSLHQDELWWFAVLNVTDAEARYILASYDSLGALADLDPEKLESLLAETDAYTAEMESHFSDMMAEVRAQGEANEQDNGEPDVPEPPKKERKNRPRGTSDEQVSWPTLVMQIPADLEDRWKRAIRFTGFPPHQLLNELMETGGYE